MGSPRVRVSSFLRCLPYLRSERSPFGVSDITMMWLLIQLTTPLIRFLFVSTGFCAAGIPLGQSRFLQTCGYPQRPCDLLMVQGVTPAHKGLFPKGSLRGTLKINGLHYRKPTTPMPGTHKVFPADLFRFFVQLLSWSPGSRNAEPLYCLIK
jgi:hypothetical protein